jgi:phage-related protein
MHFEVVFYSTSAGEEPVSDLLDDLRSTQPTLHKLLTAKITLLEDSRWHGPPHTEQVDPVNGIFELRVGRRDIARVFFYFRAGRRIVLTNGYVKQRQKLDQRELARAQAYKRDWESRNQ